jgi:hypothetical protein
MYFPHLGFSATSRLLLVPSPYWWIPEWPITSIGTKLAPSWICCGRANIHKSNW